MAKRRQLTGASHHHTTTTTPPPYFHAHHATPNPSSPKDSSYELHYIIDPTGWGIQLDMQATTQPSGCSDASRQVKVGGDYNPACDLGSC